MLLWCLPSLARSLLERLIIEANLLLSRYEKNNTHSLTYKRRKRRKRRMRMRWRMMMMMTTEIKKEGEGEGFSC